MGGSGATRRSIESRIAALGSRFAPACSCSAQFMNATKLLSKLLHARRPPLAGALAVLVALLATYIDWITWIELNVSVTYGLPLVLSVATRNRRLLWGMTTFLLITTFVVYSLQIPPGRFSPLEPFFIDRLLAAAAVLVIACLLHYRMAALDTVEAQGRMLRQQNEELADLDARNKMLDEFKTEFFSNIHHELRTPLMLILGPIQKRLAAGGLTPEARQDLEVVERNARLLERRVNDLLNLSKLDAGRIIAEYADVDLARLARLVAQYFELLTIEYGVSYTIDIPDSLPAQVDPPKIERILVNLLSNAFKFAPAGGSVRFAVRRSGDRAIVEVEDSGPGIPPELRESIFERFWQAEGGSGHAFPRGTGLGLSIVKDFVSLHGGTVTVGEPASGKGSLFTVVLPLSAPSGTEIGRTTDGPSMETARQAVEELGIRRTVQKSSDETHAPGTAVVLVIEDNPDMNAFIAGTLAGRFHVFSAFDGQEGLEKALTLHPDLILCDVVMPGMSGDQLVRELRRRPGLDDVPIVLLSGVVGTKLEVELLQEGAQDFLHKPFRPEELLAKAERIINDRRRAAEELRDMHQLSSHLLEVRDRERKQVANELSENVAQYLAGLGMYLSSARNLGAAPSVEVQRFLDEGRILLQQYSSDIQTMAGALYPEGLDELGLAAAIRSHVRGFNERHGVAVSLDIPPDLARLPAEHELALFRIMEEALTNVRRHSGSKTATVRVFCDASEVGLEVIDAGRGMSLPEGAASGDGAKGTGIQEMRERVKSLGGRLEITSGGDGTSVRAMLSFVPRQSGVPRS